MSERLALRASCAEAQRAGAVAALGDLLVAGTTSGKAHAAGAPSQNKPFPTLSGAEKVRFDFPKSTELRISGRGPCPCPCRRGAARKFPFQT